MTRNTTRKIGYITVDYQLLGTLLKLPPGLVVKGVRDAGPYDPRTVAFTIQGSALEAIDEGQEIPQYTIKYSSEISRYDITASK